MLSYSVPRASMIGNPSRINSVQQCRLCRSDDTGRSTLPQIATPGGSSGHPPVLATTEGVGGGIIRRKHVCRAGLTARLKPNLWWPLLPSILLSNVRSLENKLHYLHLNLTTNREVTDCALIVSETCICTRCCC